MIILLGALVFIPKDFFNKNNDSDVKVFSPKAGQEIGSPLIVEGQARGTYFFEASFPIKITDEFGNVLGSSYVQAQSDWMTESFVPFRGEITYKSSKAGKGYLVLQKDNPSGLPQYDKEFKMPVVLKVTETTTVKVYFNNSNLDPEISCNKVFPVEREIPKTGAVATAAIDELFLGATEQEKSQGYFSAIPAGSKLNSISINNGVASVDFNEITESGGGSCSMAARVAQITQTLLQFPTVESVKLLVNGRTEDIFQP